MNRSPWREQHRRRIPISNIETRADASYYTNYGGHPPQTDLLTDRAIVTEAYTVIPRGVLRDIVTSVFPEWTGTRADRKSVV